MSLSYSDFIASKVRVEHGIGPSGVSLPAPLFDWQAAITRWAIKKGRAALFADCGLGKSFMQLAWAQPFERTLILAPLCVAEQTVGEGAKLGIPVHYARNASEAHGHRIAITNYERLDDFDLDDYEAVVLDESSILKAFDGKTRTKLIDACQHVKYRLCCTATPSPNDIAELANHAEFLGLMTRAEFLASWFVHDDQGWRLKGHAAQPFYRWLASWAIALRSPADLGYSDAGFTLPRLTVHDHILSVDGTTGDMLFPELSTKGLSGRLAARRGSLEQRIDKTVALYRGKSQCQWLIWCGLNEEADGIADALPGAVNVQGSDTYAEKVGAVQGFLDGSIRVLVSKIRILGYGLNFQHCHHVVFCGLGDSYEQYYQAIRRCWRFGQKTPVDAHVIISEAEQVVVENVRHKEAAAAALSHELIIHMRDFEREELAV